ncbi:MAG: hypothetical protein GY841_14365 [FCB group bacterium]|nr:hypothetical protein [FCB group bacterium]
MNCKKALQLLYEVIDKEADKIDSEEVEKHLKNCRHCMAQYEFERIFKTFVTDSGNSTRDNTEFKDNISAKLDAIDAAGEVGPTRSPFRWTAVVVASAAALVLCFLASFWVADYYRHQTEFVPFIDAFFAHTENHTDLGYEIDPFDYLEEQTGIRLTDVRLPREIIHSVSVDTIKGVVFGCLGIIDPQNKENMVSVFITTTEAYGLPSQPMELINGQEMLVNRCKDCNVVGEVHGDLVLMMVAKSCCQPAKMAQLASML